MIVLKSSGNDRLIPCKFMAYRVKSANSITSGTQPNHTRMILQYIINVITADGGSILRVKGIALQLIPQCIINLQALYIAKVKGALFTHDYCMRQFISHF